ncbi:hypothetical protein GHT06_012845 [Daphnia sinensis]|uniref:BRCA1-associated ATM activator 1 n=1 Tax=Daphnia sinensis TaxID=1820382 RepID=A0AAD5PXU4_9CRUS|nr:hypothetical protein GHT06_012845 [Daphnia sinensis]
MGAQDETNFSAFLQKFEKALSLLKSYCDKPKSSFSENISFLLDKSLDHLKKLDSDDVCDLHLVDPTHAALMHSQGVKVFFNEVLKISKIHSIHPSIMTFAVNLMLQLTNNEVKFNLMYSESQNIFTKIQQLMETTIVENNEFKQSIMSFCLGLAKFPAGLKWLLTSGALLFIVDSLSDRTIFIRKKAEEIINLVLPLVDDVQRETIFTKLVEPILKAGNRLENHQIESDKLKPDKSAGILLALNTETVLFTIVSTAENEKLLTQSASLLAAIYAKCALENEKEHCSWETKAVSLIQLLLRRGFLRVSLRVISHSLFAWSQLEISGSFVKQLVRFMVIPILVDTDEVADHFPCYKTICQFWEDLDDSSTKSISSVLTTMLRSNSELNELTSVSLVALDKSITKLGKDLALKITRSGLFLLGCLKVPEAKRMTLMSFTPQLAINLIKSLCLYIDLYNIRWWETYETICLPLIFTKLVAYNASRNIQVTCAGLKGIKFCIQQSIHPDQVLLLNNSPESSLNEIASILHQCTVSVHWEVRDSAMEVVLEMAQLSAARYPPFQHLLINSHLLEAALSAFNDTESYVRATAIGVVAAATPVPLLWEHLSTHSNASVINSCYAVLQQDSEALARRAAAKALTLITQSGHFPSDLDRNVLYRYMSSAALSDLDWEVKLQALDFWRCIIDETLTQQGMLDGAFPEVTFSKEKQKIVRLDTKEIRSRLQTALSELGSCGCLYVLLQLVDDCDAPVREKSIRLLHHLRDVLANYQALDLHVWQSSLSPQVKTTTFTSHESLAMEHESVSKNSDLVIDEILSVTDACLVAGILADKDPKLRPDPAPVSSVDAKEFVNKINMMDIEMMLTSTSMSSDLHVVDFDSLLDDLEDCVHTDTSRPRPDCY